MINTMNLFHQRIEPSSTENKTIPNSIKEELKNFLNKRELKEESLHKLEIHSPELIPDDENPVEFLLWFTFAIAGRHYSSIPLFLIHHSKQYVIDNYLNWLELHVSLQLEHINFLEVDSHVEELNKWIYEQRILSKRNTDYSFITKRHSELIDTLKDYVSPEQHLAIEDLIYKNIQPDKAIAIQKLNKTAIARIFYFFKSYGGFGEHSNVKISEWIFKNFVQFNNSKQHYSHFSQEYIIRVLKGNKENSSKLKDPFGPQKKI